MLVAVQLSLFNVFNWIYMRMTVAGVKWARRRSQSHRTPTTFRWNYKINRVILLLPYKLKICCRYLSSYRVCSLAIISHWKYSNETEISLDQWVLQTHTHNIDEVDDDGDFGVELSIVGPKDDIIETINAFLIVFILNGKCVVCAAAIESLVNVIRNWLVSLFVSPFCLFKLLWSYWN